MSWNSGGGHIVGAACEWKKITTSAFNAAGGVGIALTGEIRWPSREKWKSGCFDSLHTSDQKHGWCIKCLVHSMCFLEKEKLLSRRDLNCHPMFLGPFVALIHSLNLKLEYVQQLPKAELFVKLFCLLRAVIFRAHQFYAKNSNFYSERIVNIWMTSHGFLSCK